MVFCKISLKPINCEILFTEHNIINDVTFSCVWLVQYIFIFYSCQLRCGKTWSPVSCPPPWLPLNPDLVSISISIHSNNMIHFIRQYYIHNMYIVYTISYIYCNITNRIVFEGGYHTVSQPVITWLKYAMTVITTKYFNLWSDFLNCMAKTPLFSVSWGRTRLGTIVLG